MTDSGRRPMGETLLQDPASNKGTAFSEEERDRLGLRGLLPPRVLTLQEQELRILENFRRKPTDLEKYIYLIGLQDRNETLFYRVLVNHIEEMMPIVYTPTVGEACKTFGHVFRRARGLYISAEDRGRVAEVLANWPRPPAIVCITDGERILGLGDLGAHGMGIPIGKLALYTACAGVPPSFCLPVLLDVGTDNEELLEDPLYTGLQRRRLRGDEYEELAEEFFVALEARHPGVLVQFEDFARENAFALLRRYRDRLCTFNDDIQGTAAVALAGLLTSGRISHRRLLDEKLLFAGAGEAATGIAELVVLALRRVGLGESEARARCWFVDSRGLVVTGRKDLEPHKRLFAQDHPSLPNLERAVEVVRPTALIGVSGQPQLFTEAVVRGMARANERPVIFALSNPTANSECTAVQAYGWTEGRAIFASGSPFPPVECDGRTLVPGQGNNVYIFPGLGMGVIATGSKRVTEEMFLAAARTLAELTDSVTLERGSVYPPLGRIREVSLAIAVAVAKQVYAAGLATRPEPADLEAYLRSQMYEPTYLPIDSDSS